MTWFLLFNNDLDSTKTKYENTNINYIILTMGNKKPMKTKTARNSISWFYVYMIKPASFAIP